MCLSVGSFTAGYALVEASVRFSQRVVVPFLGGRASVQVRVLPSNTRRDHLITRS